MNSVLAIDDLRLAFADNEILRGVSLNLDAGKITGLVGRSGSGKSMTALAAMRLAPMNARVSGQIVLNGSDVLKKSESEMCAIRGRDIGIVFQEPMTALNPLQSIGAQIAETILVHSSVSQSRAREEATAILDRVGLCNAHVSPCQYPHELSGGQRQRVIIAIAIAMKPKVLIADEPTTALDVTSQAAILALLRRLAVEDNMALMLITHNLAVVSNLADHVAVMQRGRIIHEGSPSELFRKQETGAMRELLAQPIRRGRTRIASEEEILRAREIVCDYHMAKRHLFSPFERRRAVDSVSFAIHRGENVGLVGESGCGKSTLARALLGLHPLTRGCIELDRQAFPGREKRATKRLRRKIQIVFQDPYSSFNPRHRIEHILAEPLHLLSRRSSAKEQRARVGDALDAVGLTPADMKKYPHEFSGGQRQRIAIARALVTAPDIVALDEATSALDMASRNRILELLMRLSDDRSVSYLFITHDLSVVRDVTDRVLVMKAGRIVEEGATRDIFENPQENYTRTLIKAAPRMNLSAPASHA